MDVRWLAAAANAAGAAAYLRPPLRVYDERTAFPSIEMYRASGSKPLPTRVRRHVSGLSAMAPRSPGIRDLARNRISRSVRTPGQALLPSAARAAGPIHQRAPRQLPIALEAGKPASATLWVADDFANAGRDGELSRPVLTLRFSFFCIEDDIEIRFNGNALSLAEAEVTDERALRFPVQLNTQIDAPLGMSAHWFRFRLEPDLVKEGENTVEVISRKMAREAGFTRSLSGVELHFATKNSFARRESMGSAGKAACALGRSKNEMAAKP